MNIIWNIFDNTKRVCSNLGIHSPSANILYDSITSDPYAEKGILLDIDFEVDEENSLAEDIMMTSMPYTITCPYFTVDGPKVYEMKITHPEPKIWYNRNFFERNSIKKY